MARGFPGRESLWVLAADTLKLHFCLPVGMGASKAEEIHNFVIYSGICISNIDILCILFIDLFA